jgi:hypothetical protein
MASSGNDLYYLSRSGAIWDALTGVQISQVDNATSLGYWPNQNCLIASNRGAQAALYRISLN